MQLSSKVELPQNSKHLDVSDKAIFIGSCFADNVGSYFKERKLDFLVNPFGVLYNPISVANALKLALGNMDISDDDLVYHNELWHSFYHHGSFSSLDKIELLRSITEANETAKNHLQNSSKIFVTFGTSWVFKRKDTGNVVSNNHKLPSKEFIRYRLSVLEIVKLWSELINEIKSINPDIEFVFTVSPVRHLKDGAHANQLSKSVLLLAIDELCQLDDVSYFPSYEIMLDELRDYRFYAEDLTHPSKIAIEIIAQKFKSVYFSSDDLNVICKIESVLKSVNHRPKNQETVSHQKFVTSTINKLGRLGTELPFIDFTQEIESLKNQLV